ncbi:3-oxoacyl-[acyl-carrier-protein] reductase [Marinilactibacillus piezotolerans]|uniref:3-oxoacyl-[acyl-carrier-protein] reductase n=1 Tax=Marinilactibacillus piezotolerans TaxID=258723 RepID=UPI0009B1698D|nr:3-oxoacyl-[acyl-carrier-protein] reductase [Marinilactibacillus piezotolerans]
MVENKQTVIVTGSSRGIGKAIAYAFAQEGHNIVLNGRKPISEEQVQELSQFDGEVMTCIGDISDPDFAQQLIKDTKKQFGSIDVLVNNAGITRDNLLLRMSEEEFDQTLDINLKGTFYTTKAASRYMLKQKSGSIINLASVVGQIGNAGQANYAASKAGIIGFTKSVARELAPRGITVNAIAPGFVESDMTDVLNDKVKETIMTQIPLSRLGQPEEVAEAAVFLSKQKYITGQVLNIDGGMVMNG